MTSFQFKFNKVSPNTAVNKMLKVPNLDLQINLLKASLTNSKLFSGILCGRGQKVSTITINSLLPARILYAIGPVPDLQTVSIEENPKPMYAKLASESKT